MGADIVNIVDGKFSGRSFIHLPAGDWADLRAEIVRLRGEVANGKFLADFAEAQQRRTPAPAMPNGVEARRHAANEWADMPAGEAVAWAVVGRGKVFSIERSYDVAHYLAVATHCEVRPLIYGDTTPQPADGEAVAPAPDVGDITMDDFPESVRSEVHVLRRKLANDEAGWRALLVVMQHLAHPPPAPVQAAPQEGEAVVQVIAYKPLEGTATVAWDGERDPSWMRLGARFYAHPSACELGEAGRVCGYTPGMGRVEIQLEGNLPDWLELGQTVHVSALQHRGDSRGGES